MIKSIINVDDKWKVIVFLEIDYDKYSIIKSTLRNINTPTSTIDEIYDKISYDYNCGFTYSNPNLRTSVVGINKTTSKEELMDTIIHEIDHVQVDICEYYGINLDSEPAAYLIGYLAKSFYKCCFKLFCNY